MLWEIIRGRSSMDEICEWKEQRRKEKQSLVEERKAERDFTLDVMRLAFLMRPVEMYIRCTLVMWGFLALDYMTVRTILNALFAFLAKLGKIMRA
jgi:hypothetical protein